jgi:TonB family protein
MFHPLKLRRSAIVAAAVTSLLVRAASAQNDLTAHLADQYKHKTFILRGFYPDHNLKYDSSGHAVNPPAPDDWTVAGVVRIEDVRVSGDHLKIEARRVHLAWLDGTFQELHDQVGKFDRSEKENRSLRIEAALGLGTPEAAADAALSQIFLTPRDRFADLVPDYWRPCVRAALSGKVEGQYSGCHFSKEFEAIPGVGSASGAVAEAEQTRMVDDAPPERIFRVEKDITPPKVLSPTNPDFTDEARRAKYQGTTVLDLVVDKTGQVRDPRILQPLGAGLDRKAVETASKWQFNPATKDGQPVAARISLEVSFSLY